MKMANPKSEKARQAFLDQNPFDGFKIDDNSVLRLEGRHPCPMCGKSRKFFCYTCYVPIKELEGRLPVIELPLKIDIIKHRHEIDGKSTAGHAAILAPNDVKIYTYPDIPDYSTESAVLIFPSSDAVTIDDLFKTTYTDICNTKSVCTELPKGFHRSTLMKSVSKTSESQTVPKPRTFLPITKAVFIDSTWNQSKGIYKDDRIKRIPSVVLQNRVSQFWRYQKGSPRWYLATVEAVHQFLIEIHLNMWGVNPGYDGLKNCFSAKCLERFRDSGLFRSGTNAYDGQYDNLLFVFEHMYRLIHEYYDHEDLFAYKRQMK